VPKNVLNKTFMFCVNHHVPKYCFSKTSFLEDRNSHQIALAKMQIVSNVKEALSENLDETNSAQIEEKI
jgi:hypothetical protein